MNINLFCFEVAPAHGAAVANVPETADLGGQRAYCHINIGVINAVDRQAAHIPRIQVGAQGAGLPAERSHTVLGERRRNGGIHRRACARP